VATHASSRAVQFGYDARKGGSTMVWSSAARNSARPLRTSPDPCSVSFSGHVSASLRRSLSPSAPHTHTHPRSLASSLYTPLHDVAVPASSRRPRAVCDEHGRADAAGSSSAEPVRHDERIDVLGQRGRLCVAALDSPLRIARREAATSRLAVRRHVAVARLAAVPS